ncbi:MAG: methylenetetrahydrofolate--tRNA-(uracil(54)-C(5))-methyltransferase (FADH(2)-oxidizing) TrmFO [Christensenellales bacterium]
MNKTINVIGGGLAGCEATYQLLKRGYSVDLYEMRKVKPTPCHKTDELAELVCSNSLKSTSPDTGSGLLKKELEMLDSLLLKCAYESQVPAGGALAVDRRKLSRLVEQSLSSFDGFRRIDAEVRDIDVTIPTIIAAGPLASDALSRSIADTFGQKYLYFFDAVAPIVTAESIDMNKAFFGARYDKGDKDYLNCAMNKEQYLDFYKALTSAERAPLKDFENNVFEGCMPIEIMASRGEDTMRFGPLRPVGITNPHTDEKPYAVVQLRKENAEGTAYNIVGFQTNLTFPEQRRVFGMIPGLESLEIVRYGVMHRNTFLSSPDLLKASFESKDYPQIFFAGQICGVEGYMESVASGLVSAVNMDRALRGQTEWVAPSTTIIGSLQRHISTPSENFQPMNANFGILPPLEKPCRDKKQRKLQYYERAVEDMLGYIKDNQL